MTNKLSEHWGKQQNRNEQLLSSCKYLAGELKSSVLPIQLELGTTTLSSDQILAFEALSIEAARTAIMAVGELSKLNEVDHMGGGLDLITALLMSLSIVDYEKKEFTIEHAHTSIGYFSSLAALGFLDPTDVIQQFRQGLDIPGHVSWLPGGTQLNGGRLGVMIPTAVGQALGKKARYGKEALVICHCGDAGWISGQALNGFNAADIHGAPVVFVMHRNGIQLSGSNKSVLDKDPRPMIEAMGINILEISTIHDFQELYAAYGEAYTLAKQGRPSLIYPTGFSSTADQVVSLKTLGEKYGILKEVSEKAEANNVAIDTSIWIPGALMSYRDVESMLDCVFLVNDLPGGKGHHDGHMKGRDLDQVLSGPMLELKDEHKAALAALQTQPRVELTTKARPAPGSENLPLSDAVIDAVELPLPGKMASPRAGSQAAYKAIAQEHKENVYIIGCDLDASTKLDAARKEIDSDHQFEMSIEEQVSTMMANGLAMASHDPQLVVFSTFSAFFAGIAREGMDMWRYQRNLNGSNEGVNVTFHMSHVGACTGRDHFSGWDLDWINAALSYLPYLHHFYAPADARSAFIAVRDLAAHYGAHMIGIPRDNLPVLSKQDSDEPLYDIHDVWEPITTYRTYQGAEKAIISMGAPSYLAADAAERLSDQGEPTDVYIINGLPAKLSELQSLVKRYPKGVVTVEDGIISSGETCLQGLAGFIANVATPLSVPVDYIGISDPRIAPADGYIEVWEHFGLTADTIEQAITNL